MTNFVSRSQLPIQQLSVEVLNARIEGVTNVRSIIEQKANTASVQRQLIGSMNYGVNQCIRELKRRKG